MSNTINLNYMTRMYNNLSKTMKTNKNNDKSFLDYVEEGNAEKITAASSSKVGEVSTQDMTMEEYKQYIYDKISALPMNPSRMQDNISINISESGFEAMKNDPEYEAWVLNHLEEDFMVYNPWTSMCGEHYDVKYIGASPEEYRGESWYAGYQNGNGASLYSAKSKDSFWEQKAEQKKRVQEQNEKLIEKSALEKKRQRARLEREYLDRMYLNRSLLKEKQNAAAAIAEISRVADSVTSVSGMIGTDIKA